MFENPYTLFPFFYVFENTDFGKKLRLHPENLRVCDMESCSKNIYKIRNVTFIFFNERKIQ